MQLRTWLGCLLIAGCAPFPQLLTQAPADSADVVLLGEQHDAAAHPRVQREWVERLVASGTLAAVTVEMAERGTGTAGLPRSASEEQVRQALRWTGDNGWPWERYRPAIMAAVRGGVPVLGANLPRAELRSAMADRGLDVLLPGPALKAQQQAIRSGHCEMLPESQITPMTRVQIARDRAMAQTIASLASPGRTVLLIAGSGHVSPDVGVPQHLPPQLRAQALVLPREETGKDYCAEFRRQMERR
jgi:uncharacterized iron-regulated protein